MVAAIFGEPIPSTFSSSSAVLPLPWASREPGTLAANVTQGNARTG